MEAPGAVHTRPHTRVHARTCTRGHTSAHTRTHPPAPTPTAVSISTTHCCEPRRGQEARQVCPRRGPRCRARAASHPARSRAEGGRGVAGTRCAKPRYKQDVKEAGNTQSAPGEVGGPGQAAWPCCLVCKRPPHGSVATAKTEAVVKLQQKRSAQRQRETMCQLT